ncbi:MAG: hypothetical protein HC845_15405 [Akkermansiaceae bacterium]|nr:hypothetical protein [Akkermansiaceae bacterium]
MKKKRIGQDFCEANQKDTDDEPPAGDFRFWEMGIFGLGIKLSGQIIKGVQICQT